MGYYNNGSVGGNIGLSGQFLGIPVIYWAIGAVVYFGFIRKK